METWKKYGTTGKHLISNYGRVMSVFKYSGLRIDRKSGIREVIRKPQLDKDGYEFYCIDIDGSGKKTRKIHKDVFRYFISSEFSFKDQICHTDGKRRNNHASNLYKGNQKTNTLDKYRHGSTKLTINQVREIKSIGSSMPQKDIAKLYNVRQNYISRILSGTRCIYI